MAEQAGIKDIVWEVNAGEHSFVFHGALLWDEKDVILVDTNIPGQLEVIREGLLRDSFSLDMLTKVIITHQDLDHIGSLHELVHAAEGRIEVFAHELTKPYILGEVPIIKRGIKVPATKVDVTLQDGDVLPYCGGIQVIFTPGHTPDHISLYHQPTKTLITGDALTSENGVLMPPNPRFTPDMQTALKSVEKLIDMDIETVITFHGGVVRDRIKERLTEIASGK
ncbi:MBL fold metallo-hydrolase [Paenibacillus solisilvae]|uniref:MBL fold metallo-hydrolase n=1 Tax=Paenibacillus solisilvae TaxID=2486751 RepID=A0ABW0VZA6_9BACL